MPLSLPVPNRRTFLTGLGSAIVSFPVARLDAAEVDEDLIALINDTHIGEMQQPDSDIPRNLKTTVDWLLALPKRPACVLINGDLAFRAGLPGDYRFFAQLIQPLRDAGMPVHLTLGNHDQREVFYEALNTEKPAQSVVASKHVTVAPTRRANFFLLDSLQVVNKAPGEIGQEQLAWLGKALDSHTDKPAVVIAHHNPRFGGDPLQFPYGLIDSDPLWAVFAPRRNVKAFVHGHIHHRNLAKHQDIHIVNTPATSYVGKTPNSATGWTMARLRDDGMTITTHTHLADHAWNNAEDSLAWR